LNPNRPCSPPQPPLGSAAASWLRRRRRLVATGDHRRRASASSHHDRAPPPQPPLEPIITLSWRTRFQPWRPAGRASARPQRASVRVTVATSRGTADPPPPAVRAPLSRGQPPPPATRKRRMAFQWWTWRREDEVEVVGKSRRPWLHAGVACQGWEGTPNLHPYLGAVPVVWPR
jgi:hypothetical protein